MTTDPVTVTVTAEHIAAGEQHECETCPIALAVAAALPGVRVVVGDPDVRVVAAGGHYWAKLPPEGDRFIADFDGDRPVRPFAMVLRFAPVVSDDAWEAD